MDRHKSPAFLAGLRQKEQQGCAALSHLRRRFCQTWRGLPKAQKCVVLVALLEFLWIAALQFQVYELADTISMQRVRIAQLEKQAKKQNNMLYSASQTLDDIEKNGIASISASWKTPGASKNPKKTRTPYESGSFSSLMLKV